jgi:hypothetical protein
MPRSYIMLLESTPFANQEKDIENTLPSGRVPGIVPFG